MSLGLNDDPRFYIVAREPGAEHPAIPTWASEVENPAALSTASQNSSEHLGVDEVPGAFQISNVLDDRECARLLQVSEKLGYLHDAAVSLPRSVRHNDNVTWVADATTVDILWHRCAPVLCAIEIDFKEMRAVGINARFRFYRYQPGDFFKAHTDGAWTGSAVVDRQLIADAYGDRLSLMSFLIFLSDGYEGGRTQFYMDRNDPTAPAWSEKSSVVVNVRTAAGAVLCFPHGPHRQSYLHASEPIESGTKYIIRTDVLFQKTNN